MSIYQWSMMMPTLEEKERILLALETIQICQNGYYEKDGCRILLSKDGSQEYRQVVAYSPEDLEHLSLSVAERRFARSARIGKISIVKSDSLQAALQFDRALVMNFANARHPGGGFLYGGLGQEEDLCRASTLYASISSESAKEMYAFNRKSGSPVDSDYMLLSPITYISRDAAGVFLDKPFCTSVITVPAPDKLCRAGNLPQLELDKVMKNRLRNMLRVAVRHKYRNLILGAWGCGAFGNDANDVARCFHHVLAVEHCAGLFDNIVFAIPDNSKLRIFQEQLSGVTTWS